MKKTALRLVSLLTPLFVTATAFAQDAAGGVDKSSLAFAAGGAIGVAAFGGALGQGKAAAAALEGIARNPNASDKLFTPMILGLALIESLVIYALVIAYMLQDKI
ncbi:MAG: ATP synthase F0 subunit C [Polyangiales bacterium]|nr:ATP synthase F0 subunit C [Myxococcales bacterium]MCB9658556.1 ATP synthase F0 subunit C [Sandaracinaceae bacterium]